jgi:hypothetical protein
MMMKSAEDSRRVDLALLGAKLDVRALEEAT